MRFRRGQWKAIAAAGLLWLAGSLFVVSCGESRKSGSHAESHSEPVPAAESQDEGAETHEVEIRAGRRLGYLDQRVETPSGTKVVGIQCSTCHEAMEDRPMVQRVDELETFHSDMEVQHGELTCNSCHAAEDRDQLKMADGRQVGFEETMDLCGQCHGPQLRDYRHGAHGGMTGHWDLRKGPRQRNHCVNCHDPHAPSYPTVQPAPPPNDRSMRGRSHDEHGSESGGTTHE